MYKKLQNFRQLRVNTLPVYFAFLKINKTFQTSRDVICLQKNFPNVNIELQLQKLNWPWESFCEKDTSVHYMNNLVQAINVWIFCLEAMPFNLLRDYKRGVSNSTE